MLSTTVALHQSTDGCDKDAVSGFVTNSLEGSDQSNVSMEYSSSTSFELSATTPYWAPKKKYMHQFWQDNISPVGSASQALQENETTAGKYRVSKKFKESRLFKVKNSSISSGKPRPPLLGRIRHPKNKQEDFRRICLVCTLPAEYYNSGAISCESCKMFFRRNYDKLHVLQCVAVRNKGSTPEMRLTPDWLHDIPCDLRQMGKKRLCALCRLKKCFTVGMRPVNQGARAVSSENSQAKNLPPGVFVCPAPDAMNRANIVCEPQEQIEKVPEPRRLSLHVTTKPPDNVPHDDFITKVSPKPVSVAMNWCVDARFSSSDDECEEDPLDSNGSCSSGKVTCTPAETLAIQRTSVSPRAANIQRFHEQSSASVGEQFHNMNNVPYTKDLPSTTQVRGAIVHSSSSSLSIVNGFQLGTSVFYLAESDPFLRIILDTPKFACSTDNMFHETVDLRSQMTPYLRALVTTHFTSPQQNNNVWTIMRHYAEELGVRAVEFCRHMPPLPQWSVEERRSVLKTRLPVMVCHLAILFADAPYSPNSWSSSLNEYRENAILLQLTTNPSVLPVLSLFITRMNEVLQNNLQLRLLFLALKLVEVLPDYKQHLANDQLHTACLYAFRRFALQMWRTFVANSGTTSTSGNYNNKANTQRWVNFCQLFAWSRCHFDVGCMRETRELHTRPEMGDLLLCLAAVVDGMVI